MKKRSKTLLAVAGVISAVLGIMGAVPSFLKENYGLATGSALLVVVGIVLLAIAFED